MLEDLHHVQLAMPKGAEAAARDFYSGLLGLEVVEKPPVLAARGGLWFERGNIRVHLGVEQPFRPAKKAHVAFRVRGLGGLAALADRLAAGGCDIRPDADLPGFNRFYTDDPFGNRLEFLEPEPRETAPKSLC
ncbi:MAG: glyoxalase [Rhodobacterales bacterium]|nr:MAG: glyoxalase [Rhodobacterales bacterium]